MRILLKTQFGEKRGMGRTMERKIGGKKVIADVVEEELVGLESVILRGFFKNILNVFLFSPSVCREADSSLVKERLTKQNLDGEIGS